MDWPAFMRQTIPAAPQGASRRQVLLIALASVMTASPALARRARGGSFAGIDTDNDDTIDLDEAKRAGAARFDSLDRGRAGKLTHAQLGRRRLTAAEFAWADRDHDGTIDRDEYLALVERQFRAVDVDNDGTVDRAEFNSRAGLPLRRLLY